MKQIRYLSVTVAFIVGFGAAMALFYLRSREQADFQGAFNARVGASLGKEVAILSYLDEGKTNDARFVLELWLNNDLIAMDSKQTREGLNAEEKKIFEMATTYRRQHPFASTNYGVAGGDRVEEVVEKITRR